MVSHPGVQQGAWPRGWRVRTEAQGGGHRPRTPEPQEEASPAALGSDLPASEPGQATLLSFQAPVGVRVPGPDLHKFPTTAVLASHPGPPRLVATGLQAALHCGLPEGLQATSAARPVLGGAGGGIHVRLSWGGDRTGESHTWGSGGSGPGGRG